MTDKELQKIRQKISCPQLGDEHYGEWGILTKDQRFTIKKMLDHIKSQEMYIEKLTAEKSVISGIADRDRLIELLDIIIQPGEKTLGGIADHLLANGVIVPKRETDEHKIQIGDVLYEYSYTYGKVHEWKVLDIWLENYISGNKTIVKCSNGSWTKEFFVADVLQFHKTKEEAEAKLKELGK